jgi:hypothetical protein
LVKKELKKSSQTRKAPVNATAMCFQGREAIAARREAGFGNVHHAVAAAEKVMAARQRTKVSFVANIKPSPSPVITAHRRERVWV